MILMILTFNKGFKNSLTIWFSTSLVILTSGQGIKLLTFYKEIFLRKFQEKESFCNYFLKHFSQLIAKCNDKTFNY